jgi:hypothetical protein
VLAADQGGDMAGLGRAHLGDQRDRAPAQVAAETRRPADRVGGFGSSRPQILEQAAANVGGDLVAGLDDGDLGERRQPGRPQDLLTVDPHPWQPALASPASASARPISWPPFSIGTCASAPGSSPRSSVALSSPGSISSAEAAARPRAGSTIATGPPISSAASSAIPRSP